MVGIFVELVVVDNRWKLSLKQGKFAVLYQERQHRARHLLSPAKTTLEEYVAQRVQLLVLVAKTTPFLRVFRFRAREGHNAWLSLTRLLAQIGVGPLNGPGRSRGLGCGFPSFLLRKLRTTSLFLFLSFSSLRDSKASAKEHFAYAMCHPVSVLVRCGSKETDKAGKRCTCTIAGHEFLLLLDLCRSRATDRFRNLVSPSGINGVSNRRLSGKRALARRRARGL